MSYRLLVCDLDGTLLLGDAPDLDLALVDGLQRAMERGLLFTIATGRMPPGMDRYRDELGVTAPMIFYNGALVRDHEGGRCEHGAREETHGLDPARRHAALKVRRVHHRVTGKLRRHRTESRQRNDAE